VRVYSGADRRSAVGQPDAARFDPSGVGCYDTNSLAAPGFRFSSRHMDKTLHDLGGIVLNGLPTFFLVLILAVCVKYLYLKPLEKVLAERFRLTEGARKAADESLRSAGDRVAEYEQALVRARGEIYEEQAEFLRRLHDEQAEQVRLARQESDKQAAAIKASIAQDAQTARLSLESQSDTLASQIADAILERRVA